MNKPNVIFVFSDQHRAEACGYAGNPDVLTPNMERLAGESVNFSTAVSGMPVCSPYRASLITGRYPHHHGVFVNDVCLNREAVSIAEAYKAGGYATAYIGKWHLDGHGRSSYIPQERRQGFEEWKVLECTHDYNHSKYYDNDCPEAKEWEGYDAFAQTEAAIRLLKTRDREKPLFLMLSWGPPHSPYDSAPERFKKLYEPEKLHYRPNVSFESRYMAMRDLPGYYAHVSALDSCLGMLMETVDELGMAENTIFVYTSDHGDMLGSQAVADKQKPWDESILVPFLLRYPAKFGRQAKTVKMPINTPDIMPTLLELSGLSIPATVDGISYAGYLENRQELVVKSALLQCLHPFGQWHKYIGGREYRGIRTERYTYVKDLHGPWLLYDNEKDPYQLVNLLETKEDVSALQEGLEEELMKKMQECGDEFLPGSCYLEKWNYQVDFIGTVPYTW